VYAQHPRTEWLKIVLGMVGLVGSQIWWTWEVEDTFRQVASYRLGLEARLRVRVRVSRTKIPLEP
jgi:hypothetical protein